VRKKLRRIERRLTESADSIDRRFEELCALLEDRGCLRDWVLTEKGQLLRGVFHSSDLLVVEALSEGLFDDLDAPSLAALVSCITYQSRTDERTPRQRVPSSTLRERIDRLDGIATELIAHETEVGQPLTGRTDEGFVAVAHHWADGGGLSSVIDEDLTGGDFVRQMKQLIDLLRQIGLVAPRPLTASIARQAAAAIDRGVVTAETA
jgi:ATP-dependent RNA helicase HelY